MKRQLIESNRLFIAMAIPQRMALPPFTSNEQPVLQALRWLTYVPHQQVIAMLKNIKLVHYFSGIVVAFWAALLLLAGVSWWGMSTAASSLHTVHSERMSKAGMLGQMAQNITRNRMEILLIFQHDPQGPLHGIHDHSAQVHFDAYAKRRTETNQLWDTIRATQAEGQEAALTQAVDQTRKEWVPHANLALDALKKGEYGTAVMADYLKAGRTHGEDMIKAINALHQYQEDAAAQAAAQADRRHHWAMAWFAVLAIGLGLPATLASVQLLRRLGSGLAKADATAHAIAQGDLTLDIHANGKTEIDQLLGRMDLMQRNLVDVISQVRSTADSIEVASAEVAAGNADLSQRTEQTAGNLQQTASSTEQLGVTVRQNADNAREANQLAMGASEVASRGGIVVGQVVDTMKGINDSSKRIADIIGVIDGIAFQTNILALNAAVEAARAGEQGRGFAVVAGEVRSLAQRSAEAAREIKALIATSVVNAIQSVSEIVGRISLASTEQSEGVSMVGHAVSQMDEATQQNAALVEQSAAAAESLRSQAQQLVQAVAAFRLG
jgi:methyl-accepting chemotaxis protein